MRQLKKGRLCLLRRSCLESVEKVDTLPRGNAVRSKIFDFRTALYPRQYHPCALEKPLAKRFFRLQGVFPPRLSPEKQNAAIRRKKSNFRFIDRLRTALPYAAELSCCFFYKAGAFYFLKKRRIYCIIKRYKFFLKGEE